MQWRKEIMLEKLDNYMQKMKLDHCLPTYTKNNSRWIKDLNIKPEILKFIDTNTVSKLLGISFIGFVELSLCQS